MLLKDLEFIIPTFQIVSIDEYIVDDNAPNYWCLHDGKEWYKINGLNREVISIYTFGDGLVIEVYGK